MRPAASIASDGATESMAGSEIPASEPRRPSHLSVDGFQRLTMMRRVGSPEVRVHATTGAPEGSIASEGKDALSHGCPVAEIPLPCADPFPSASTNSIQALPLQRLR